MAPSSANKVSTSDFLISFGPDDSYIARAPKISRSNLPNVSPALATKLNDCKSVNFILFPSASGDPYVSYSKGLDNKLSIPDDGGLPELKSWLKERWGTGGVQVVGDGKGGWWGLSTSSTKSTPNLPRDVRQLLKPHNPHGKVTHVAFGVAGAYVIVFEDGHIDWDLKSQYERLDTDLESRNQGDLVYVSLSAYQPNVFFAAYKDATVLYDFPKGTDDLDEDFISAEGLRVIVSSDTAKHTGAPVSKAPGALRTFSTDVLKGAAEDSIANAISI